MSLTALKTAILEAERFLNRARLLANAPSKVEESGAVAERATVRRASMDLTRALAALRRTS